jgi:hypothetical protein
MGPPARRQVDREPLVDALAPRVQVAEAHQIDVVVGVQMANDDAAEPRRVQVPLESRDHALPTVEQQAGVARFHQQSGCRGVWLRLGGATADDRQAHESWPVGSGIGR